MKILFVNQHFLDVMGGSEIQCHLLAAYLARTEHEVVYFAVNGMQLQYDVPYPVEPGRLCWNDIHRIVKTYAPDLVYWRFNKRRLLPSVLMFRLLGVRVVFAVSHINDVRKWSHKVRFDAIGRREKCIQRYKSLRPALSSRINHAGYHWVDGVVAQLKQQCGVLVAKKEIIIPNSVDESYVPFHWEKPFVLWASSLKAVKNPELFITLAKRLKDKGIDFLMAGKTVNSHYEQLIKEAAVSDNFHYLGTKSYQELNGMLRKSLFLVHTCEPEGFPNVFIQAWSQQKPVVSAFYDPDNMIRKGGLGFCSGDVEQFVLDVERLIAKSDLRREMGSRAETFARETFSLERNGRKLSEFLHEIYQD
ncbi:hypothetical protein CSB45_00475 [candidate division KSB3 bacterium]|uniref:Glycosyl transferase family 1 domain-containing protein n=1 Tax=candidate division KSB3 bacterium TaxID=2044937 RepID=A0A2G6EDZ3_9BACT|nr:MAG: hypothetical protein CSB45_00475 [candidate division KSB3 bacterium]